MSQAAQRCAETLAKLIAFDTVNPGGDEPAMCAYLADTLAQMGADQVDTGFVERPGQTGAWVFARFGTPTLIINAHVDTVPPNRGWTRDPHVPEITSDRVFGLGACDTKGAIAAALTALQGARPNNVGFLFTGDEERDATVVPVVLGSDLARDVKTAIVCEPTSRRAGVRHRGVLSFEAHIEGAGGHSSKADHLPKPIVTLARLAVALDELAVASLDRGPPDMKGLCLNVAMLDGGVAFNVIPEKARLAWSARQPPNFDVAALEARQLELAHEISADIRIVKVLDQSPFAVTDDGYLRQLLGDGPVDYVPLDFWTEAALFAAHGIDAVVVGPGDIAQAHGADEFVTLDDLDWATRMFEHALAVHSRGS